MTEYIPQPSATTESDWPGYSYDEPIIHRVKVDDEVGHELYVEEYGRADGEPVIVLHGGPGGACSPELAKFFDPDRYRIILFDQRGCGKSTPSVAENGPEVALKNNTTADLVEDIVKLRTALNIDTKMHVFGGSWGSTLAMTYAEHHPETVQSLILRGIFLGNAQELDYMYQGNAPTYPGFDLDAKGNPIVPAGAYGFYPEEWARFVEFIPPDERHEMRAAYKRIFDMRPPMSDKEIERQQEAAIRWSVWEGVISHRSPDFVDLGKFDDPDFALNFAQIEAHYFSNGLFLQPNEILDNLYKIKDIPMHIVQGRLDVVTPMMLGAEPLVAKLGELGVEPASYIKSDAGHSALEGDTTKALCNIMDELPRMEGFEPNDPAPIATRFARDRIRWEHYTIKRLFIRSSIGRSYG